MNMPFLGQMHGDSSPNSCFTCNTSTLHTWGVLSTHTHIIQVPNKLFFMINYWLQLIWIHLCRRFQFHVPELHNELITGTCKILPPKCLTCLRGTGTGRILQETYYYWKLQASSILTLVDCVPSPTVNFLVGLDMGPRSIQVQSHPDKSTPDPFIKCWHSSRSLPSNIEPLVWRDVIPVQA